MKKFSIIIILDKDLNYLTFIKIYKVNPMLYIDDFNEYYKLYPYYPNFVLLHIPFYIIQIANSIQLELSKSILNILIPIIERMVNLNKIY